MRPLVVVLALCLPATAAVAQGAPSQGDAHAVVVMPDQVEWTAAPPSLPAGAKVAVLEGNPREAGTFAMRISLPDGYRIPPHFHPAQERLTVVQGTFQLGMGDKFDKTALKSLPAGAYASMHPGMRHFAQAKGNTIVQVNGTGPWKLTYVNPADDPQKATP